MKNIRENLSNIALRKYIVPISVFVVITSLSLTFARGIVDNIIKTQSRIDQIKSENLTLTEKRDKLKSLNKDLLTRQAQVSLLAVPSSSSGPAAMSAVRTQAFEKNVAVTEVKLSEKEGVQKGARETTMKFELTGNLANIIALIDNLKNTAPIVKIAKIKMLGAEGSLELSTNLDLQTFWAMLPKNLPPANKTVTSLTKKDLDLIAEMEKLRVGVGQAIVPAPPAGKTNPFTE